jgi:hypothetical protein
MSGLKAAATLTGALLVCKGGAGPSAFIPRLDLRGATVQSLTPRQPRHGGGGGHGKDNGKTRLSLRLSSVRHLRVRLAAAHLGQSTNAIIVAGLDYYLDHVLPTLLEGRCACLERGESCATGPAGFGGDCVS